MSDPHDRSSSTPEPAYSEGHGESLFDRIKIALGLKAPASAREELADALREAATDETSGFSPEERAMLSNILDLRGTRVDDVMVPRADIIAVPIDTTLAELLTVFQTAGHSRLPVYGETLDDPRGMVHIRDFVAWMASRAAIAGRRARRPRPSAKAQSAAQAGAAAELALGTIDLTIQLDAVKSLVRSVLFVPPSMPAIDLLAKMQTTRTQLALVIDEYGGTDGLVSMEDIVEIVIGDIEDEHDEDEGETITPAGPGLFNADARADLDDVAEAIGIDPREDEMETDVDTLGGLLVTLAGRVPVRGEIVPGPGGLEFEIVDADPRRVKRVRIHVGGESATRAALLAEAARAEPAGAASPAPDGAPAATATGEADAPRMALPRSAAGDGTP